MGMGEKAHETWNKVKLCYRAVLGYFGELVEYMFIGSHDHCNDYAIEVESVLKSGPGPASLGVEGFIPNRMVPWRQPRVRGPSAKITP